MLCPIHTTDHRGPIDLAHAQALQDIIRAREALEPDDLVKLDVALAQQLVQRLERGIPRRRFLQRVIRRTRVDRHRRDPSDPERDPERDQHGFGQIGQRRCRIVRGGIEHRDEDVLRSEAFGELNDDGELVDQEVIGGMDDDGDVVEFSLSRQVLVVFVDRVLTEWTFERGTALGDPSVEAEQVVDRATDDLLVQMGRFLARHKRFLKPVPEILESILDLVVKQIPTLVSSLPVLEERILVHVEVLFRQQDALEYAVGLDVPVSVCRGARRGREEERTKDEESSETEDEADPEPLLSWGNGDGHVGGGRGGGRSRSRGSGAGWGMNKPGSR